MTGSSETINIIFPVKYFTCFGAFSPSLEARQPWLHLPVQFILSPQTNLHQFKPSIKRIHPYLQPPAQTGNSSHFCWKNKMFLPEEMKKSSNSVISCVWMRKSRGVAEERPGHCPTTHRSTTGSANAGRGCPESFLQSNDWSTVCSPGHSSARRTWKYWSKSSKGLQRWRRDCSIPQIRRGWDSLEWRREGSCA